MCTTCGCASGDTKLEDEALHSHEADAPHWYVHADGSAHSHTHDHMHEHSRHAYRPGRPAPTSRIVAIEQDILARNDTYADQNRKVFDARNIFALNLVSSPGSGKTTLLVKTIEALRDEIGICVVEGDQQTANDAERIRTTGVPAVQINTGKGCHLDAHMVGHAIERLNPPAHSLFLIENVGNLVCPAAFALGEHHKVAILSVTEGEDKPLKYPDMFRAADVLLLNKCDLLPYLEFDADLAEANARRVNPDILIFRVSATKGEGMAAWLAWLRTEAGAQA
ncbi:MAG TPA: hydrogenase nickel incorporation protein HypB [Rhodocyclaceae bacterium]|nr:hydrogenase nickel incorporation protein HypB [Rhodocyclaceae bacterium]